jgi:hypothetical protein
MAMVSSRLEKMVLSGARRVSSLKGSRLGVEGGGICTYIMQARNRVYPGTQVFPGTCGENGEDGETVRGL